MRSIGERSEAIQLARALTRRRANAVLFADDRCRECGTAEGDTHVSGCHLYRPTPEDLGHAFAGDSTGCAYCGAHGRTLSTEACRG